MPAGTHSVTQDGNRLVFEIHDSNFEPETNLAPILFIHGWAGDRRHWHHQVETLQLERRLISVDLLGHGDSDKPDGEYSMARLAGGILAVLEAAAIQRAVIVGHSNGVLVARAFALEHPEYTAALVLLDGKLQPTLQPAVAEWMQSQFDVEDFTRVQDMMARQLPRGGLSLEDYALLQEGTAATPRHVHKAGLEAMLDPATFPEDPITQPVLVIMASSAKGNDEYEAYVRRLAPQVEYRVLDDCGHPIQLEQAEEFAQLLASFLSEFPKR